MTTDKQMREAFEKSWIEKWGTPRPEIFYRSKNIPENYQQPDVQLAWFGYQAAHSALMPAIKEARDKLKKMEGFRDCGCRPCRGQCASREALMIEADAVRDLVQETLATLNAILGE